VRFDDLLPRAVEHAFLKAMSSEIFCAVSSCRLGFMYIRSAQLPTMPSAFS